LTIRWSTPEARFDFPFLLLRGFAFAAKVTPQIVYGTVVPLHRIDAIGGTQTKSGQFTERLFNTETFFSIRWSQAPL
jgi:hypothetical protein